MMIYKDIKADLEAGWLELPMHLKTHRISLQ